MISNRRRRIRDLSRLKGIPDRFRKSVSQLFVIQECSNHWRGALCIPWNSRQSFESRSSTWTLFSLHFFVYLSDIPSINVQNFVALGSWKKTISFSWNSMEKEWNPLLLWRGYFLMKLVWASLSDIEWKKWLSFDYYYKGMIKF